MMERMLAPYGGRCRACGERIEPGDPIVWSPVYGAYHDGRCYADPIVTDPPRRAPAAWPV